MRNSIFALLAWVFLAWTPSIATAQYWGNSLQRGYYNTPQQYRYPQYGYGGYNVPQYGYGGYNVPLQPQINQLQNLQNAQYSTANVTGGQIQVLQSYQYLYQLRQQQYLAWRYYQYGY